MLSVYLLVGFAALTGLCYLAANDKFGWLGLPVVMLLLRVIQQAVFSPLLVDPTRIVIESAYARRLQSTEVPAAYAMVIVNYICVGIGLLLVASIRKPSLYKRSCPTSYFDARRCAWLVYVAGFACHLVVLWFLSQQRNIFSLASNRAVFTDRTAAESPLFGNALILSSWMLIGALALIAVNKGSRIQSRNGLLALLGVALLHVLHGSRGSVLRTLAMGAIAHYYANYRWSPTSRIRSTGLWLKTAIGSFALLVALTMLRFATANSPFDAARHLFHKVFGDTSIVEAGSIRALCPRIVPFQYGATYLESVPQVLPGVRPSSAKRAYIAVVTKTRGKHYAVSRGGGETFTASAEAYLNFGDIGIVCVPILIGIAFGIIFDRQRQYPDDPFLLVFTVVAWGSFIMAIDAKPVSALSELTLGCLVPCAWITSYAKPVRRYAATYRLLMGLIAVLFILWRGGNIEALKPLLISLICVSYYLGTKIIAVPSVAPTTGTYAARLT